MNFKLITWPHVVFVTTQSEGMRNGNENPIVLEDKDTCDGHPQIKCSNDCSSLKVCYDATMSPLTINCPANRPFCANGKCGAVSESCLIQPNDDIEAQNFVCTSDGIFPDPINCTNWYVCDGATVTQVSCDAGYIFNSKTYECVRRTPSIDHASKNICRKISCDKKPNGYISFPANPAYYAYCSNGSMLLYKCDDVDNQMYAISSKKCVFNCRAAGYFPDPSNCTVYYFCKGFIKKFKATTLYCAAGQYFDGTKCVIGMNCGTYTPSPTIPTPPTPTTEDPTSVTPPTATTESTTFTSIPFPTTASTTVSTTTDVATPPTASTEPPTSTVSSTRPTPPTPPPTISSFSTATTSPFSVPTIISHDSLAASTVLDYPIDQQETTKSPNVHQSYSIWKHKGKYSIRLS